MRKRMWLQKAKISAVHEDDLLDMLETLGFSNDLKSGKIRCPICNTVIHIDNIGAIYHNGNGVQLICDKPSCLTELDI